MVNKQTCSFDNKSDFITLEKNDTRNVKIFVAYTEIFSITMNYLLLASKLEPSLTMINETFGEREKTVCHQKQ